MHIERPLNEHLSEIRQIFSTFVQQSNRAQQEFWMELPVFIRFSKEEEPSVALLRYDNKRIQIGIGRFYTPKVVFSYTSTFTKDTMSESSSYYMLGQQLPLPRSKNRFIRYIGFGHDGRIAKDNDMASILEAYDKAMFLFDNHFGNYRQRTNVAYYLRHIDFQSTEYPRLNL